MEKYQIIRPIGKGSYGDVFLVRNLADRKQYVLKKIFIKKSSKEKLLAQQEVKLLSELHHPNIVEYKDSFLTDKGQYMCIVMAFCEGGDLFSRLKAQNKKYLSEKQIVDWFVQIALALHYLHQRKVLHRDLKTQNTFLTKNSIIKLGDFGIARVLENSMDMAKTMIGTPYYMSPELFDNKPYNYKSDVWALGCCVYEMTALRHAFDAKEMPTLIMKILKESAPAIPSHYSQDLQHLIKLMLTKSPSQRPSVAELLQLPFIKAHMAASVADHQQQKPQLIGGTPAPSAGLPSTSSSKKVNPNGDGEINNQRNKIAEELSREEELKKKLELKLKKIEISQPDSKSERPKSSARRTEKSKPGQPGLVDAKKQDDRRKSVSKDKDKQEVKIQGSKIPYHHVGDDNKKVDAVDLSGVKKQTPRRSDVTPRSKGEEGNAKAPRPLSHGKGEDIAIGGGVVKKDAPTPRPEAGGAAVTPTPRSVSQTKNNKDQKLSPTAPSNLPKKSKITNPPQPSSVQQIRKKTPEPPIKVSKGDPLPSPHQQQQPNNNVVKRPTEKRSQQPPSDHHNHESANNNGGSGGDARKGGASQEKKHVPVLDEDDKLDNIAAKTEKDFFAARIASMRNKNSAPPDASSPAAEATKATPPPTTSNKDNKNIIITAATSNNKNKSHTNNNKEETAEDFPVVECSYDSLLDHDESDDEDKISARLRRSTVKIQQITDELHDIDDAERDLEMEEMISIYDSYVKNGVDEIPDDGEESSMNMVLMTGNLSERINALRQYCIEGLGQDKFDRVYTLMQRGPDSSSNGGSSSNEDDDLESKVENVIGHEKMDYFNYVRQIIFCEHSLQ